MKCEYEMLSVHDGEYEFINRSHINSDDSLNETDFICVSTHFNEKNINNKTLHDIIANNAEHNINCFPFTKKQ